MTSATAAHWFGIGLAMAWGGVTEGETTHFIDYLSDTIKVALFIGGLSAVLNRDTNQFYSDLVPASWEIPGTTPYTQGGKALASKTLTYSAGVLSFKDATTCAWAAGTVAGSAAGTLAKYAIIYKDTGDATTSPLMGYVDFAANGQYSVGTGTFTITWAPASTLLTITIGS